MCAQAGYHFDYSDEDPRFQLIEFRGTLFFHQDRTPLKQLLNQIHGEKDILLKVEKNMGGYRPHYVKLIKTIRNTCISRGRKKCTITSVFSSECFSACTLIPLLSDRSISLSNASFGFHRLWIISPGFVIQSKNSFVRYYVSKGADQKWFEHNQERLTSKQFEGYFISKEDEIHSGLIDEQYETFDDFLINF